MPTYTFKLRDDDGGVEDDTGINLPNAESGFGYACDVVHEMMARREKTTRHWQLDVYENGRKLFEIPFASLDRSLDHLPPGDRKTVQAMCEHLRSAQDVRAQAQATRREARALVSRSRGKPYLAADRGKKVIRD